MAEFCKDCFKKMCPDWIITEVSREKDICEGCGEWKPVVISAEPKQGKWLKQEVSDNA